MGQSPVNPLAGLSENICDRQPMGSKWAKSMRCTRRSIPGFWKLLLIKIYFLHVVLTPQILFDECENMMWLEGSNNFLSKNQFWFKLTKYVTTWIEIKRFSNRLNWYLFVSIGSLFLYLKKSKINYFTFRIIELLW